MQTVPDAITQRQIDRETRMLDDGLKRALRRDESAARSGEQTRVEKLTIVALVPKASAFLAALVGQYDGGRPPSWWSVLRSVDLDETAAAAVHVAFANALRGTRQARALTEFGRALEVVQASQKLLDGANTARQRTRVRSLTKNASDQRGRRKVVLRAAKDAGIHDGWDETTLMHMGEPLMNAALSLGLFELVTEFAGTPQERTRFALSAEGTELVREVEDAGMLARPVRRPMVVCPRPWESLDSGAYLTDAVRRHVRLVRTDTPEQVKLLRIGIEKGNMKAILRSTTAIQSVPLRINRKVWELRQWAWEAGLDPNGEFPMREGVKVEEVPADIESWSPDARAVFWANRAQAKATNDGIAPNLLAWEALSAEARDLLDEPEFYLPHNLDFRGRAYPVPVFSHHHGDATKALFEFARGHALGEHGIYWLAVHLANCGDFGKISKRPFYDRVAWVWDNLDMVRRVAEDPRTNREWLKADAPFSFYAACVDFVAAIDSGDPEAYVSHLPVALDGSNSGVQHYSAATRAEEGRFVNLTPELEPQDLYREVAVTVARKAAHIANMAAKALRKPLEAVDWVSAMDAAVKAMEPYRARRDAGEAMSKSDRLREAKLRTRRDTIAAILWHLHGIERSTVKRPVMTFGYSSEAFGMAQQVRADFMDPLSLQVLKGELPRHPFGADRGRAAAGWLGKQVYRACTEVLPKVSEAMRWLQRAAEVLAHEGKGVLMVTPLGFPMLQKVTEWETKKVDLHLLERTIPICGLSTPDKWEVGGSVLQRVRVAVNLRPGKTVVKHKQASGVAPNVIHACDSTHLHMVVLGLLRAEVRDFLLIHDSFAVHAGNVPVLNEVLRETLIDLYSNWNPLEEVAKRAGKVLSEEGREALPELPEPGKLNLQEVRNAKFCFS